MYRWAGGWRHVGEMQLGGSSEEDKIWTVAGSVATKSCAAGARLSGLPLVGVVQTHGVDEEAPPDETVAHERGQLPDGAQGFVVRQMGLEKFHHVRRPSRQGEGRVVLVHGVHKIVQGRAAQLQDVLATHRVRTPPHAAEPTCGPIWQEPSGVLNIEASRVERRERG